MSGAMMCGKCGEVLPYAMFPKHRRSSIGVQSPCKDCRSRIARQKRLDDPEKTREKDRAKRVANIERCRQSQATYRQKNRELLRQKNRIYSEENRELIRQRANARRAKNLAEYRRRESERARRKRALLRQERLSRKHVPLPGFKTCTACKQDLPKDSFYGRARSPDGLSTICKQCELKLKRARRAENPAQAHELYAAAYRRHLDKHRRQKKEYYAKNSDRLKEYQKLYKMKNPELVSARQDQYRRKNRYRLLQRGAERRKSEEYRTKQKEYLRQWRESLGDGFIAHVLKKSRPALKAADIPKPLIEAHRMHILVKRELKPRRKPR